MNTLTNRAIQIFLNKSWTQSYKEQSIIREQLLVMEVLVRRQQEKRQPLVGGEITGRRRNMALSQSKVNHRARQNVETSELNEKENDKTKECEKRVPKSITVNKESREPEKHVLPSTIEVLGESLGNSETSMQQSLTIHDLTISKRKLEEENEKLRDELKIAKALLCSLKAKQQARSNHYRKYSSLEEEREKKQVIKPSNWNKQAPKQSIKDRFLGKTFGFRNSDENTNAQKRKQRQQKTVNSQSRQSTAKSCQGGTSRRAESHLSQGFVVKAAGYSTDTTKTCGTQSKSSSQLV